MNLKNLTRIILLVVILSLISIVPVNAVVYNVAFDSDYYYNRYADLQNAIGNVPDALYNHFVTNGVTIQEQRVASPVFDVAYYLNTYPDLQKAFGNDYAAAYNHFLTNGVHEARIASANFNPVVYMSNYEDLRTAFGNDYAAYYTHYVYSGVNENRQTVTLLPGATAPEDHVHEFTVVSEYIVEPTCKVDGTAIYECAICGEKEAESRVVKASADFHDWVEDDDALVAPTCMTNGKTVSECSICGEEKEDVILADEKYHNWGDNPVVTKGDDDFAGYEVYQCKVPGCGKYKTVEYVCKHDYRLADTTATCESSGENIYICNKCEDEKTEYVAKLGHDVDTTIEANIDTPATCYTDGLAIGTCRRIGCENKENARMVIPASHKWEDGAIEEEAKCETAGRVRKACTVCGITVDETIPATGHTKPATVKYYPVEAKIDLDKNGNEVYVKNTDGKIEYKTEELLGNLATTEEVKMNNSTIVKRTLCAYGIAEVYTCSDCKQPVADIYSDIVGHNYKITKSAKCTTPGTKTCENCKGTETIPATGHSLAGVKLVKVTDQKEGDPVEYIVRCKSCGQFTVGESALNNDIKNYTPSKTNNGPTEGTITFSDSDVWNVSVTYKKNADENYEIDTITIVDKVEKVEFVLPKYESVKEAINDDLDGLNKNADQLLNDVEIAADGTISGTLGYVKGFDAFPAETSNGHFLVLYFTNVTGDETITVTIKDGTVERSKKPVVDKDHKTLIVYIQDKTTTIELASEGKLPVTLKMGADLVLAPAAE